MKKTVSLSRNEKAKSEAYFGPFNSSMAGKHILSQEAGTGKGKLTPPCFSSTELII